MQLYYVHNKIRKTKFDEKSWKGVLVGYLPNGYRVWNTEHEKYETVRDVIVDEINFLQSRPKLRFEGNEIEHFRNTELTSKSGSIVPQGCTSSKSGSLKSDSLKSDESVSSCKIRKLNDSNNTLEPNVDNQASSNKTCSSDLDTDDSCKLRRSARLKGRTPVSYNEIDEVLLCA